MPKIFLAFLALCTTVIAEPLGGGYPLRAVYLHSGDLLSPDDEAKQTATVRETLDDIAACQFTTLFPYANTSSGTAFFESAYAESTQGDLLGTIAKEAHARRLHLMPSVCVLVQGHDKPAGILLKHPEWALRNVEGEPLGWISPAVPEAREWVASFIEEVVKHTDADGVLLDYLRFPNEAVQLDTANAAAFDAAAPPDETAEARKARLQAFKEESITALMQLINEKLRALDAKRKGKMSFQIAIYTWGPHVTSNHKVAQPWPAWVKAGYLDRINVSGYCYPENYGDHYMRVFEERMRGAWALAKDTGRRVEVSVALGIKTSHGALTAPDEIDQYHKAAGGGGISVFSWRSIAPWKEKVAEAGYFSSGWRSGPSPTHTISLAIDLGKDLGQNFGTLFELHDENGHLLAGAGFPSAYNTYYRASRLTLQVFARPGGEARPLTVTQMPRPSDARHHYLFDVAGKLYATDRKAGTFEWEPLRGAWRASKQAPVLEIGGKAYELAANRIALGGADVFTFDKATGTTGSYYYTAGHLFFHFAVANDPNRATKLFACPWDPDADVSVPVDKDITLDLSAPGEFPYSYGQLGDDVIVGSNSGGVYRFRAGQWATLRKADPTTSFQIYTMMNHHERLLMGQYPTGELFEIVGDEVRRMEGWPPRLPGATPNAREAQTLALYRGELFVGVWPWGEVWRHTGVARGWESAARLFTRPALDLDVTAPYEDEMTALGEKVNNLWGQRITTLLPLGSGLIASTANKNGAPYEERLTFLGEDQGQEYGAAYRLELPGHLAAPVVWADGKLNLSVEFSTTAIQIRQDGKIVATARVDGLDPATLAKAKITLGKGVYGPFKGETLNAAP